MPNTLEALLSATHYLSASDRALLCSAYAFGERAHEGQLRQTGEAYITHPLAVAGVCAQWRLDVDALRAALLHDTVEDCGVPHETILDQFGSTVSALVRGLTKLDQLEFQSREEAQAENFRKMLMAMADDVRVILIKLADRLHNMRTLGVMSPPKRTRIARETLEIYAPIAHRLGLNEAYREFEDLCFAGLFPKRYKVLQKALLTARGNRKEVVNRLTTQIVEQLPRFGLTAEVTGREKSLFSIYLKMREKRLSFAEVLDIYGFRITVETIPQCYVALGALHALFKPSPGRFKDYIALPKSNGYQSLHTVVIGPYGTPLEFQIRTKGMHRVAEAGVAAHWLYKEQSQSVSPLQQKAHEWMQSLLSVQSADPREFLDHLKIDLFPDVVYVFTPKGSIKELPRGATPVDFAYTVHTDVGNRCVGAVINGQPKPLDVELRNGDVVRIETRADSIPHPGWLGFVRTAKARAEIRHLLKTATQERAIGFGRRLLDQAVRARGASGLDDKSLQWNMVWHEMRASNRESLYESIGLGHSLANVVARRLMPGAADAQSARRTRRLSPFAQRALELSAEHLTHQETGITLNGSEGNAVQYAHCCYPIAGDNAWGHMRGGSGLIIHRASCQQAKRQRAKEPPRWADIHWGEPLHRTFETHLVVEVTDSPGVLALVAAAISTAHGNILDLRIERQETGFPRLHIAIEVRDRLHLAEVLRKIRRTSAVTRASRASRVSQSAKTGSANSPRPSAP